MSIQIMSLVFNKSKTRGNARLILLSLADNASDEGYCFPSIETIARKAGVSRNVTKVYLRAFKQIGLVLSEKRGGEKGEKRTSNEYWIMREKIGQDEISKELLTLCRPPNKRKSSREPQGTPHLVGNPRVPQPREPQGTPASGTPGYPENHHSNHHPKSPAREKTARPPTEFQLQSAHLEEVFSSVTKLPKPKREEMTKKQEREAAVRWWNPIGHFIKLANGQSEQLMRAAITAQLSDNLDISAPASIVKKFDALWVKKNARHDNAEEL